MFEKKFWGNIKQKYPLGYKKFIEYISNIKKFDWITIDHCMSEFNICYCNIKSFFKKFKFILIIDYDPEENDFFFWIYKSQFNIYNTSEKHLHEKTEEEVEIEITKIAFEILEKRLLNKMENKI